MMDAVKYFADLHVHSRFSRATSREGNPVELAVWARRKGLALIGTGDVTHPHWRHELRETLVPAEQGLFRLRPDLERETESRCPCPAAAAARFLLQGEISTIYKRDGRTRKVHHLVFVPGFDAADRFSAAIARVGNIASDGRPILGLDSRDLLEILLAADPAAFLIPAHVWTPWFSALGSQSGFDSIAACYRDLAGQVFAAETGLSSDPPMNWRVSAMDRYRLVSNSDAHSPSKLGREACVFEAPLSFPGVRRALETGVGYAGTVEFFPEEGKYHMDGHRQCGVCLEPRETRALRGLCPECGKPLTIGVLHRVDDLADRAPSAAPPKSAGPFRSFVPLAEMLSETLGFGPASGKVAAEYESALRRLGPELTILDSIPPVEIESAGCARLAEAIARMRAGRVLRRAGFDGEYGTIRLFAPISPGRTSPSMRRRQGTCPASRP